MTTPNFFRNSTLRLSLALFAAIPFSAPAGYAARGPAASTRGTERDEPALIATLQSSAGPAEKDAACAQLKHVGTARAIPALQRLLGDVQLSDSARYVLEAMSAPEAGAALLAALGQTSGAIQLGIINSLGVRREASAVPALAAFAQKGQPDAAAAAIHALGEIANDEALRALQGIAPGASNALHATVVDALLRCAQRRLGSDDASSRAIFASLRNDPSPAIRIAAFRGTVLASGAAGVPIVCDAITGPAGAEQLAALHLVHELTAPTTSTAVAQLLPRLDPVRQVAVIGGLAQRNAPEVAGAIAALAASPNLEVKLAVITALGELGDDRNVTLLAGTAAKATGPLQAAARDALANVRRGEPAKAMLEQLPRSEPAVQAELARALAARHDESAVPKLLSLAQQDAGAGGRAATIALARLGDEVPSAVAALVTLIESTKDDTRRTLAANGLSSACQHIRYRSGQIDSKPFVAALGRDSVPARVSLLPVCAKIEDPAMRTALRQALADRSPAVREAAIKALCDTTDIELLPDLLKLATVPPVPELRTAAVGACARLASAPELKLSDAARLAPLRGILAASPDVEQQRIILASLAEIATPDSLSLVSSLLGTAGVADDAAQAALQLVPVLPDSAETAAVLQRIAAGSYAASVKQAAQHALLQRAAGFGFITAWQTTGPFRQEGRDYADLFEFVLKPETADTQGIRWKELPAAGGPTRSWRVDLRPVTGDQECVAFAQTWIHADRTTPVQLEFGSNTPAKVWLNQTLVHTNPSLRVLRAGTDKVPLTLKPGWNCVLLKVAQRNESAGFSFRALQPDGKPLEGIRISPAGPDQNQPPKS